MNLISTQKKNVRLFVSACIILTLILLYAVISQMWFLIAIPIGFFFGFFLQKGDLCGSSAFSEVIMMKDRSKVFGLWVAIIVSMGGIAILDVFNLVTVNPKPMLWLNFLIGGAVFGVGMVLAGGCVSGCLYKTGTGNINSMAALVGIPIGIALVEFGPLHSLFIAAKKYIIPNSNGGSVTLSSLTGLPFWVLTLFFIISTIIVVFIKKKNNSTANFTGLLYKAWKPWLAGIAIGLLVIPAYLSSFESGRNYPLGVTHGVLHVQLLATDSNLNQVYQKQAPKTTDAEILLAAKPKGKKVSWWLILLVTSLVAGSWISAKLSNSAKLKPKPPEQTVIAFFGGILVGTGAAFATGCVIGNIISGWALMSVGLVFFGIVAILMNWVTTYFYLMGGRLLQNNGNVKKE
jgi:uncharacterized membrane protein YedE/YeeE